MSAKFIRIIIYILMKKTFSNVFILFCLILFVANENVSAFQITAKEKAVETKKDNAKDDKRVIENSKFEIVETEECDCVSITPAIVVRSEPFYMKLSRIIFNPLKKIGNFFVVKE